nr:MAG TPA: zinc finger protein [Caudoviricetes sp.]
MFDLKPKSVVCICNHPFVVHLLTRRCLEPRKGQHIHKPTHQDGWPCGARSIQMVNLMGSPVRNLASFIYESETSNGQKRDKP